MSPTERKEMINQDSEPDQAVQAAEDQPVIAILHAGRDRRPNAGVDE